MTLPEPESNRQSQQHICIFTHLGFWQVLPLAPLAGHFLAHVRSANVTLPDTPSLPNSLSVSQRPQSRVRPTAWMKLRQRRCWWLGSRMCRILGRGVGPDLPDPSGTRPNPCSVPPPGSCWDGNAPLPSSAGPEVGGFAIPGYSSVGFNQTNEVWEPTIVNL